MKLSCKKYTIKSIFYDVQISKSNHDAYKRILKDIFSKSSIEDFLAEFVECLKICLMHEDKSANVEKTLDFAAEFAVSFSSDLTEDETCPLLEGVFQFIFENHDCHIQLVRLRICQLMNRLLDNMGHDATVVEETYNKIAESMLVRLQDSMSSVRTQAVYALHRLQSPNDPKCDIIKAFIFHMTHDPCYEVRRAVIQKIAVNKMTLASILTRMNDVKDSVRKESYIIINRLLIRQFTIKQRQLILETGLGDRSDVARDYVIGVLVPNWLKHFSYDYYGFLECIHVEKIPETGIKLLKGIFGKQHDVILESRMKEMWIINQKISYKKLDVITAVYWRALAEYVKPTEASDKLEHVFEQVLPDLTPFCKYIREYFFPPVVAEQSTHRDSSLVKEELNENIESSDSKNIDTNLSEDANSSSNKNQDESVVNTSCEENKEDITKTSPNNKSESNEGHKPNEAVLVHLLEMCKVYDLADEMGRTSLRQLCVDLLQSPRVTLQTVPVLASLLDLAVPCVSTKLSVMAEIITELREPLQSDGTVYLPHLLLMEAEDKKVELGDKLVELSTEMEIAQELGDEARVEEIKVLKATLTEELKIMNTVIPHEPGRNLNNDPDTLRKCLTIVVEIMKKGKICKMNPTLYSLMQNFIVTTLNLRIQGNGAGPVKNLALQALGIFCVLDAELAKEHFMMFCFNIATESLSVTALKCVFDLLHVYGLANFNIEDPDEASIRDLSEEDGTRKPNLVVLLMSLLTSESAEMRKTAVIGLCRLLFAGRIKSSELVSKLILLWYNPIVECDPHIRQPLGVFFRMFSTSCPHAPELLQSAFIPTIKEFFKLEVTDPMMEVDVESVADIIVNLTRPNCNSHANKEKSSHNQMAIQICEEVLSEELESPNCIMLLKMLSHLELNFDLTRDINILSALTSRMVKAIPKGDKAMARLAVKFETMLQVRQESNKTVSTVNNTLPADVSIRSSTNSQTTQLLLTSRDDSESESEAEPDEEELSQDEMALYRTVDETANLVIPGTPESSESEGNEEFKDLNPKSTEEFKGFNPSNEEFKGFNPSNEEFKGFDPRSNEIFKGFDPPAEKLAKMSQDLDFKFPPAPPSDTPAKTPFKVPAKTPRKNAKTPAKTPKSLTAKTPVDTATKTTRSAARTPIKGSEITLQTPEKTASSDRVTRSSRKRKS